MAIKRSPSISGMRRPEVVSREKPPRNRSTYRERFRWRDCEVRNNDCRRLVTAHTSGIRGIGIYDLMTRVESQPLLG